MNTKRITDRSFFTCKAEELAPKLLGKILCRSVENRVIRFRLTEVEAYCANDTACHSNKYKTGNGVITQHMIGGTLYVHYRNNEYCGSSFDIVANTAEKAESVLIRGGINIDDAFENYDSCPRLLGEALYIDYEQLNQTDLASSNDIWLEDDGFQADGKYLELKRIGLDSAKDITPEDKNRLLRFKLQK